MNKLKIFLAYLILLTPVVSYGPELTLITEQKDDAVGEEFQLAIQMDTEGNSINAVDGKVYFEPGNLEIVSIKDGNSSINFWITKPNITPGGIVDFSGVTPGGMQGKDRHLFSVILKPIKVGKSSIEIRDVISLKNDGLGTRVRTSVANLSVEILDNSSGSTSKLAIIDSREPESFLPTIGRDSEMYEGKNFVVFSTQDKESGIAYYEVKEGVFGSYVRAVSPFVLSNQNLDSMIYVKAVDFNNNERVVSIKPYNYKNWYKRTEILGIIVVVILFAFYNRKKWFNLVEE